MGGDPARPPRRAAFIGPPGAGKGTQARLAAQALHVPHLSTGDLLRAAVRQGTATGREAEGYMRAGKLVPDALVLALLRARIGEPDAAGGFILDGFPRNVEQERSLSGIVALDRVLYFDIPLEALLERLVERRVCPRCDRVYNRKTRPPREEGKCDDDGTALHHRPDDTREAVTTRFEVYQRETTPLLALYRERGILRTLSAAGGVEDIRRAVLSALG